MKCPYCGREMLEGMIWSDHTIYWKPGENRWKPAFLSGESKLLSIGLGVKGAAVVSYNCTNCDKIIIDCSGNGQDMNLR